MSIKSSSPIASLIEKYKLLPHPEGGFYSRSYTSEKRLDPTCLGKEFSGVRPLATAIYFLIPEGKFSAFHRLKNDEVWHFYKGDPVRIHTISDGGVYADFVIGDDLRNDSAFQYLVPAGTWMSAELVSAQFGFGFVGCTVAPGFDFEDLEMGEKDNLIQRFPEYRDLLNRLCL
ncbi:MAG: cupin domain-containing protein [Chitinophagaceae bacterium]|jgi:predicted cupin superfamily sugar epimerase